jgi:hypothetical protein
MRDFWNRLKIPKAIERTPEEEREWQFGRWLSRCPERPPPLTENEIKKLRKVLREALESEFTE